MFRAKACPLTTDRASRLVCIASKRSTNPLSPIRDTLIEGFSHFVTSMTRLLPAGAFARWVYVAASVAKRKCPFWSNSAVLLGGRTYASAECRPARGSPLVKLKHRAVVLPLVPVRGEALPRRQDAPPRRRNGRWHVSRALPKQGSVG
jgi:hypothetical protein